MNPLDTLKDKIRQEEGLPENLSWENTKDGIYSKMKEEDEPIFFLNWSFLSKIGILASLLLLSGVVVVFYMNKEKADSKMVITNTIQQTKEINQEAEKRESINELESIVLGQDSEASLIQGETKEKVSARTFSYTDKIKKPIKNQEKNTINQKNNNFFTGTTTSKSNKEIVLYQRFDEFQRTNSIKESSKTHSGLHKQDDTTSAISQEDRNINIDYLRLKKVELFVTKLTPEEREPMLIFSKDDFVIEEKANNNMIRFLVQLGSGINYSQSNYGSSVESQNVAALENLEHGYSSSLRINIARNNLFISTGLDWRRTYRQIEGSVNYTFQEEHNLLTEVIHHPFTGVQEIYSNTMVNVTRDAMFKNHNRLEFFTIPVVGGFQMEKSKFTYRIGAGVGLSFAHKSMGLTVREGRDVRYGKDNVMFKKSLGIDLIGEFEMGYKITEGIQIGGRLSYMQKTQNHSLEETIKMLPSVLNGELVFGFNF